jgi:hypothetical protein
MCLEREREGGREGGRERERSRKREREREGEGRVYRSVFQVFPYTCLALCLPKFALAQVGRV